MNEITLEEILASREERARLQSELLQTYKVPLISFTMNIAGPIKTSELIRRVFYCGIGMLEDRIEKTSILFKKVDESKTGYRALYAVLGNTCDIKNICVSIEDGTPVGRLFDMDVIDTDGKKLDRSSARGCIVCDAPGRFCAATRAHTIDVIWAKTEEIIKTFFLEYDSERVAYLAYASLMEEVRTTPKPGLVDLNNTGSHTDMDIQSFYKSAETLRPYFKKCFLIGAETATQKATDAFEKLRSSGVLAEGDMYRATNGVNTHKGMIYSLGILCGAIGRLWQADEPFAQTERIFIEASMLAHDAAMADLASADGKTAGSKLYKERKITGIRGEAANGFPSVSGISLPILQNAVRQGIDRNGAGILALLYLIANVEDTNLYSRGGESGAIYAREYAKKLIALNRVPTENEVRAMDAEFIKRNLSPGGCADLLAITYFIDALAHETK